MTGLCMLFFWSWGCYVLIAVEFGWDGGYKAHILHWGFAPSSLIRGECLDTYSKRLERTQVYVFILTSAGLAPWHSRKGAVLYHLTSRNLLYSIPQRPYEATYTKTLRPPVPGPLQLEDEDANASIPHPYIPLSPRPSSPPRLKTPTVEKQCS